jgi:hypothetical protein
VLTEARNLLACAHHDDASFPEDAGRSEVDFLAALER